MCIRDRTNVSVIVSHSVFDAENDGKVRFTLRLAVVEILPIQLFSIEKIEKIKKGKKCMVFSVSPDFSIFEQMEQVLAMPSSTTTQCRVKRTFPSFST